MVIYNLLCKKKHSFFGPPIGLTHSGVYPSILSLGTKIFSSRKNLIISILTAAGSTAGFVSSIIVSFYYNKYNNIQIPMIIVGCFILISFIQLVILFKKINRGDYKSIT
jgi:fucose permease